VSLELLDLGRMAYVPALEKQRTVHHRVLEGDAPPTLILVEHDPVITLSARRGAAANLVAPPARLAALGIDVQPTDRGGDITYHGPGQLVAYPILRLGDYGLSLGGYMRFLEQTVIETVAEFGVNAAVENGATGVWAAGRYAPAKLCAFGVRVRRGVTLHGLALNVTTDLSHFDTIVPCGLAGRAVTSLERLLGEATPSMGAVKSELTRVMRERLTRPAPSPTGRGLG
jgi:lipoyl(octanoyl) transferase